jgi:hypothetical protein
MTSSDTRSFSWWLYVGTEEKGILGQLLHARALARVLVCARVCACAQNPSSFRSVLFDHQMLSVFWLE